MRIIEEYIAQILIFATLAAVIYMFRDKIWGSLTGAVKPAIESYTRDIDTITSANPVTIAKDIITSRTAYISQQANREAINAIDQKLLAQGIIPARLRTIKVAQ